MSIDFEIKRVCHHCEKPFTAHTTKTKYCSHICNQRAYKARIRKEKIENINNITHSQIIEPIKVKEFLSIKEVCLLVGISRNTVYRLIKKGKLNRYKLGARVIIKRSDLDKLLEKPQPIKEPEPKQYGIIDCYSLDEVKEKYHIADRTLHSVIKKNNIPILKRWRHTFIPKEIINELFKM